MKIVIRAGGSGTRLWPASRENNPKQFQALIGKKTFVRDTVDRVKPLLKNNGDLFISVNQKMAGRLKKEISELPVKNIILEPTGRNTGPAMCLESCFLARRFGEDAIVASLPSDDYISDAVSFRAMLREAEKFLEKNSGYIVTPGARPTYPDAGYSYIKIGEKLAGDKETKIFKVADWVEKPDVHHCKKLIQSRKYFYHTGMYIWELKTVLDLFRKFQPEMYEVCSLVAEGRRVGDYEKLPKISVETAITNRAPKIAVAISEKFVWSDLGKWQIIAEMLSKDAKGNVTKGKNILIDTKNSLVYGPENKLVATIGLDGIVIVLTEDALLVCPKDRAGEVKKIVEELGERGLKKYL
ncbi:mannose-1-phosphate guanylyltransferase [Candidatus Falkowbacteria bacterium]|nr:mannose-1-phosphate guanylyltransferase [Candidatus Falkowbacteria bacterium]